MPPLPMLFEPTTLVFLLAIFFLASYIGGRMYNVVHMNRLKKVLGETLSRLGSKYKVRAAGTKMLSFSGESLGKVIGQYSITVFLMGRENLLNWGVAAVAGRGDMAILRARISGRILLELDVIRKKTPPYRRVAKARLRQVDVKEFDGMVAVVRHSAKAFDVTELEKVVNKLRDVRGLWSFSLRREVPELMVSLSVKQVAAGQLEKEVKLINDALSRLVSRR